MSKNAAASSGRTFTCRRAGTVVVWPAGVSERYGISSVTRWRMERDGRLPPRDVFIAGKPVGWRPTTLEAAERGAPAGSPAA